ncbi:GntR family transcriptional regulator [Arthrobacter sp. 35W]|uniref:GntR family transcriptional regulator n=1 Tax=Arthrobacter sp. 35W TaxID=1132441 RepID=UPI0003F644D0|nr:GntR family transcriptional regulator [Arthrobacter sp. 35W]
MTAQYALISAELRRRIIAGEFAVGSRLPSEAALAAEFGVTRSLVRRAMAQLARQSLVRSSPRGGWFAQAPHQMQELDRMQSFAQWAQAGGRVPGGLVTERGHRGATAREAQTLGIRLDEPLLCFTRVRTLDGTSVMVERSVWAPWAAPVIEQFPDDGPSTTAALAAAGIHVALGHHRIEAVAASQQDAELLGVRRSSPLLQVSRVTTTRDGRAVELGEDRYRAGTIAFEVNAGESTRTVV